MSSKKAGAYRPDCPHMRAMVDLLGWLGMRRGVSVAFRDLVAMSAISISNSVDLRSREQREVRYLSLIKGYSAAEIKRLPEFLGELTAALEAGPRDVLGELYMGLGLSNDSTGQYFTPWPVASLMARMVTGTRDQDVLKSRGFLRINEPAAGSGVTVLAAIDALMAEGVNHSTQIHVVAQDLDETCVMMCYLQLSLWGIPAIVYHGNTISMQVFGEWYTPIHILFGWNHKLRRAQAEADALAEIGVDDPPAPERVVPNEAAANQFPPPSLVSKAPPQQMTLF